MENVSQPFALGLAVFVFANVFASFLVLRNGAISRNQRLAQLAVVWFVPLLGAIFCGAFAAQMRPLFARESTIDPLCIPADGGVSDSAGVGCSGSGGGDGGGD